MTEPLSSCGNVCDSGAEPQTMRIACSTTIARPNVTSSVRIGSAV